MTEDAVTDEKPSYECPDCRGNGWVPCVCDVTTGIRCDGTGPCPRCNGIGYVNE